MNDESMVEKAEQIIRDLKGSDPGDKGTSQLSRAQEVANEAPGMKTLLNWLRYQRAREKSGEFWSQKAGSRQVGERVEAFLEELEREKLSPEEKCRRAARFFGYLRRAYVARNLLTKAGN